jgi:WXG100 family type VII secretion target
MSDGMLKVNFGALQQASADIQNALGTIDAQLDELNQAASPLVATWDGAAKEAYAQRQATWTSGSQDIKNILREIKVAVDESAADYQDTETRATNLFG